MCHSKKGVIILSIFIVVLGLFDPETKIYKINLPFYLFLSLVLKSDFSHWILLSSSF